MSAVDEGQISLDDALEKVEAAANEEWLAAARYAVRVASMTRMTFTTDDVWEILSYTDQRTHDGRALGAVMRWAAREGLIRPLNEYEISKRAACHKRPVRVWASLR